MSKGRVIVAMSGGVDSSVAALLLSRQGYDVVGVTMRLWTVERDDAPRQNKRCCSVEDVDDARRVCQTIGVPHYVMNFEREFQSHVVDYFCREYDRGRTPHPCLACNDKIKFDFLLRRAMFLDADYIATGHYARIEANGAGKRLLKGVDGRKDQSYVLFTLGQRELDRLMLPIGGYAKDRIRAIAAEAGLPVADKPDSQEICFIPDGDYRKFIADRGRPKPGEIVDSGGSVIGEHPGVQFFTVGQRRGLRLPANPGVPMYVLEIDAEGNRVVVGSESELYRSSLWASQGQLPVRQDAHDAPSRRDREDQVQGVRGARFAAARRRLGRGPIRGAAARGHSRSAGGLLPGRRARRRRHHRASAAFVELNLDFKDIVRMALEEYLGDLRKALDGLTAEERRFQPTQESHHIDFAVWHMARVEDDWIQRFARGADTVWQSGGWDARCGLPSRESGVRYTAEQVAALPEFDIDEMMAYYDAVRRETLAYLGTLSESDLEKRALSPSGGPDTRSRRCWRTWSWKRPSTPGRRRTFAGCGAAWASSRRRGDRSMVGTSSTLR